MSARGTRRSPKAQERLYCSIGRVLAAKAEQGLKTPIERDPWGRILVDGVPYEADPNVYPCPDGRFCEDEECLALRAEMARR